MPSTTVSPFLISASNSSWTDDWNAAADEHQTNDVPTGSKKNAAVNDMTRGQILPPKASDTVVRANGRYGMPASMFEGQVLSRPSPSSSAAVKKNRGRYGMPMSMFDSEILPPQSPAAECDSAVESLDDQQSEHVKSEDQLEAGDDEYEDFVLVDQVGTQEAMNGGAAKLSETSFKAHTANPKHSTSPECADSDHEGKTKQSPPSSASTKKKGWVQIVRRSLGIGAHLKN